MLGLPKYRAFTLLALASITPASLSGCTKEVKIEREQIASEVQSERLQREGKVAEAAEVNARIGEILLYSGAFQFADKMFEKALASNPRNGKASFYSALVKPVLAFQGMGPRFYDLKGNKHKDFIDTLQREAAAADLPELLKFATEMPPGKKPALNAYDVQRFLRTEVLPALGESISKLERIIKDAPEFELIVDLGQLGATSSTVSEQSYSYKCEYADGGKGGWTCYSTSHYTVVDNRLPKERFRVDSLDVKVVRGALQYMANSIRAGSAYSLEGYEESVDRLEFEKFKAAKDHRVLTEKERIALIRSFKNLGVLESDHQLPELARATGELLQQAMDFASLESSLCRSEKRKADARIAKSLCFTAQNIEAFMLGMDLLAGPKVVEMKSASHSKFKILVDVNRILHHPVKDLKSLLPTQFDEFGKAHQLGDPTVGGLFPNGDIVDKFLDRQ